MSNYTSSTDLLTAELNRLLRQEISSAFTDLFSTFRDGAADRAAAITSRQDSGINIVINNNTSASVTAQETTGPLNQKYLEITIDQMVANSLLQGRQTSGVLKTLFGIAPSLIGR